MRTRTAARGTRSGVLVVSAARGRSVGGRPVHTTVAGFGRKDVVVRKMWQRSMALEEQPPAVGGVTDGGWRVADGGGRVADGGCMATDGSWRVTDGGWRVTDGGWRVTDGG